MEVKRASSLVVSMGKAFNGIASTFEWLDWQSLRCLLVEDLDK